MIAETIWDYRYVFQVLQGLLVPNQLLHLGPRLYWSLPSALWGDFAQKPIEEYVPSWHFGGGSGARVQRLQDSKLQQSLAVKLPQMGPTHCPPKISGVANTYIIYISHIFTYSFATTGNWLRSIFLPSWIYSSSHQEDESHDLGNNHSLCIITKAIRIAYL